MKHERHPFKGATPLQWRTSAGKSLAAIARQVAAEVGLTGKNPARTYQRWETGANRVPVEVVAAIERLSGGIVTAASWCETRRLFLSRQERA